MARSGERRATPGGLEAVVRRGVHLGNKVLGRLAFFPFTFIRLVILAAGRWMSLREDLPVLRVVMPGREGGASPAIVGFWLPRATRAMPTGRVIDVGLVLPSAGPAERLHDVVSVLLCVPRVRSIALYWDEDALADDGRLWQRRQPGIESPGRPTYDTVVAAATGPDEDRPRLPAGARREMHLLLKRLVGPGPVVTVSVPQEKAAVLEEVASICAGAIFVRVDQETDAKSGAPENLRSVREFGLTLHERMALVQAADAHLGVLDELAFVALAGHRPALVLGEFPAGGAGREGAICLPDTAPAPTIAKHLLNLLKAAVVTPPTRSEARCS